MKSKISLSNTVVILIGLLVVVLIGILGYSVFAANAQAGDSLIIVTTDDFADTGIYLDDGVASTKINEGSNLDYAPATNLLAFTKGTDGTGVVVVDLSTMSQTEELLTLVVNDIRYSDFYNPVWSPDGTRLAFTAYNYSNDTTEVIIYSQETVVQVVTSQYGYNISTLGWYDNNTVLYLEDGFYKQESTDSRKIYLADLSTNQSTYLATVHDSQPYVVAAGNGIVAYSTVNEAGQFGIYTVVPGQVPVKIADGFNPVWSPDGTQIAYMVYNQTAHGDYQIVTINSDGSGAEVVYQAGPSWTLDEDSLVWSQGRLYFITSSPDTSSPTVASFNTYLLLSIDQHGGDMQVLKETNGLYEFVVR